MSADAAERFYRIRAEALARALSHASVATRADALVAFAGVILAEARASFFLAYGAVLEDARNWAPTPSPMPEDTVEVLLDLAKRGEKGDFMFVAQASGVRFMDLEPFWEGTRRRLGVR